MTVPGSTAWFDALRVDQEIRPVGLDTAHPEFTWTLRGGTNDHPATSVELVDVADGRTVWRQTLPEGADPVARHNGEGLRPLSRYHWFLRAADLPTASAEFTTGIFGDVDWAGARWIAAPAAAPTHARGATAVPELSREFELSDRPRLGLLAVAAGGYAQPWLSGKRIGSSELGPAFSDYDSRVHYEVYDVTDQLAMGRNRLAFRLGRGFYGMTNPSPPPAWGWESAPWHDEPCLRAVLHVVDDNGIRTAIPTDESWQSRRTATIYDDLYGGETFDARVTYASEQALRVTGPRGAVHRQRIPPIRVVRTLAPVDITISEVRTDTTDYIVDFGEVIAGRVRLCLTAPGQHDITLAHGEKLTDEGLPNVADGEQYFSDGFQTDRCVLDGPGEWAPSFTYHGFRYVHVTGWPSSQVLTAETFIAEVLRTDVARAGAFLCGDSMLNTLHQAVVATVEANLHGIPTDTPTYEKNGWTGDGMLATELMLSNFDMEIFLEKWVDDLADSCDATGRPQVIAPSPGWGDQYKSSPTWHAALILTPWWLYLYRGNRRILERHYISMRRYVLREHADSDDGLAASVLNDWCSPETGAWGGDAPDDHRVSGTAYLYLMLRTMNRIAGVLGRIDDQAIFAARAALVRRAFRMAFFDGRDTFRGEGDLGYRQTHNILALAFELVPAGAVSSVVRRLVADIRNRDDHLNTGVLGTKYLLPTLTRHGHEDLALRVARQTTFPSWGYWMEKGSTTLWEHWREESRSRAHYMFGTYDDWLFQDVLGVVPIEPGYRRFRVAPASLTGLEFAKGEIPTPFGPIEVEWERNGISRLLRTRVPAGCVADLVLCDGARTVTRTVRGGLHEVES